MAKYIKNIAGALAVALLLGSCGTGRTAANRTTEQQASPTAGGVGAEQPDTNINQKLRLRYFYEEAAKQQALGNYDDAYMMLLHCREINPDAAEVYYALSNFDEALNSKQTAIDDIKRAAELSPDNATYQERLAMVYVETKDYDNAIRSYEKLYAAAPDRTEVLDILLRLYGQQKDYRKMVSTVERMELADGESEKTVLTKMRIYAMQGKQKEEYRTLKNFVDRYPNDLSYQVMTANWLLQHDSKKQALGILEKVLREDPDNSLAKLSMVDYYRAENNDSIADKMEEGLLLNQQTPDDTRLQILRNIISKNESQGGDSTKVLGLFRQILSQKQENASVAEMYVAYLSLKKMPKDSIVSALNNVLAIEPDNKNARLSLIQTVWADEDNDMLIRICTPALEYNPDEMAFYYFLGFAYIQKGDDDKAYDIFRRGVQQAKDTSQPELVSDMYSYIGDILYQRGQADEAYAAYDSCLQWKEDNIACLNNYAYYISISGGDLSKAEQMSYKTVKAEPTNSIYLDTYAWVLFCEERYAEAQIYAEQALANDTTGSFVYYDHAGDIYIKVGLVDKAVEMWRKAIEAGGDAQEIERKIKYKKYIPSEK